MSIPFWLKLKEDLTKTSVDVSWATNLSDFVDTGESLDFVGLCFTKMTSYDVTYISKWTFSISITFDFSTPLATDYLISCGMLDASGNGLCYNSFTDGTISNRWGNVINNFVRAYPITTDSSGNIYACIVVLVDGEEEERLYKLSPSYTILWYKNLWKNFWHISRSICVDETKGIVLVAGLCELVHNYSKYANLFVFQTSDGSLVTSNTSSSDDLVDLYCVIKGDGDYYYVSGVSTTNQFGVSDSATVWKIDITNFIAVWSWDSTDVTACMAYHTTYGLLVSSIYDIFKLSTTDGSVEKDILIDYGNYPSKVFWIDATTILVGCPHAAVRLDLEAEMSYISSSYEQYSQIGFYYDTSTQYTFSIGAKGFTT